jgi:hypothetical protein
MNREFLGLRMLACLLARCGNGTHDLLTARYPGCLCPSSSSPRFAPLSTMAMNNFIQPPRRPIRTQHDPYASYSNVTALCLTSDVDLTQKPPRNEAEIVLRDPPLPGMLHEIFLGQMWWGANESFVKWLLESVCHVTVYAMRIKLRKHHGRLIPSGTWYAKVLAVDVDRVAGFNQKLQLCVAQLPQEAPPHLTVVSNPHAEEFAADYEQQTGTRVDVHKAFVMERSRTVLGTASLNLNLDNIDLSIVAMPMSNTSPHHNTSLPHDASIAGSLMTGHAGTVA